MSIEIEDATVGTIESIADHGSIVTIVIREAEGGLYRLNCDRRMFGHLYEAEGGDLIGREVAIHGGSFEESIEFLD